MARNRMPIASLVMSGSFSSSIERASVSSLMIVSPILLCLFSKVLKGGGGSLWTLILLWSTVNRAHGYHDSTRGVSHLATGRVFGRPPGGVEKVFTEKIFA